MPIKTLPTKISNDKCAAIFSNPEIEAAEGTVPKAKTGLAAVFGPTSTEFRVLMVGLDGAGKSVIFNRFTGSDNVHTTNTIGFNVDKFSFGGASDVISAWDMGGLQVLRKKWAEYYGGVDGVIFVIDASAKGDRLEEAKKELTGLMAVPELSQNPILIYANKLDSEGAMSVATIAEELKPILTMHKRRWAIQGTIATTGDGIYNGVAWLYKVLKIKGAGVKKASKVPFIVAGAVAVLAVAGGISTRL